MIRLRGAGVGVALGRALGRIAREDERWHAMLALNPDAPAQARLADDAPVAGPLHGRIVAVKDNIDVAGMATTSGCRALGGAMPRQDAAVVRRLKAAGAIIIGKTNLSEFSFEIRSRSSLGGDVLCPFAPHATAGGSSGGSAVAVALGYADVALGTDTGGSIRIPAACNGLVGFRPAHGSLPMEGIAPLAPSTDTVGPITRTVAEARAMLAVMAGGHNAELAPLPPVAGRRVGLLHQAYGDDPRIVAALAGAEAALDKAGVALVPLHLPALEPLLQGAHIVDAEFAGAFDAYLAQNFVTGTAPTSLAELVAGGAFLQDHAMALHQRMTAAPDAAPILARHRMLATLLHEAMAQAGLSALLYPSLRVIPDGLGNPKGGWAAELAARSGWPAITVPAPVPQGGRPVGAEVLAPADAQDLLFALASVIEAAAR